MLSIIIFENFIFGKSLKLGFRNWGNSIKSPSSAIFNYLLSIFSSRNCKCPLPCLMVVNELYYQLLGFFIFIFMSCHVTSCHFMPLVFYFFWYFISCMMQVGSWIYVQISRINNENNELILSEREAWVGFAYTGFYDCCLCLIRFMLPQFDRSRKVSELPVSCARKSCISEREHFWKELLGKFYLMAPKWRSDKQTGGEVIEGLFLMFYVIMNCSFETSFPIARTLKLYLEHQTKS